jgi:plasmid stabilization system protein ParE
MIALHFFEEASDEAEEARRWYRERSEPAESAFLSELDHAIAVVLEAPNRWPRHIVGTRRYVFPIFPYSLIYFLENQVVHVVAIAHEKRRPGYWRERLRR